MDNNLYLLLDVIKKSGSVKKLTRIGITFNQIAEYTNQAIQKGLITNVENKIVLTELGLESLEVLEKHYKKTNKEEWIEIDVENKIPKIEKNSIFLPRQNALTF
ncbi:hypothetical protein [Flavobacterium bizetiae]|uniref:hypothetical protein n=1 Tax=Flavobacterium bizetiae TaxID=2704140 RepID=UPI0037571A6A